MLTQLVAKVKNRLPQNFNKKKLLLILSLLIFTITLGIFYLLNGNKDKEILITTKDDGFEKLVIPELDKPFFELQTEKDRKFGILPQENFILKLQQPLSLEFLNSVLTTSENFTLEQINENEYKIKNKIFLSLDQPLIIALDTEGKEVGGYTFDRDYSWSFQSQGKFRVVSTIPGNEKTKVPLNTGIEIVFSQDDFSDPKRLIEISPKIDYEIKIVDEILAIIPQSPLQPETVYTVRLKAGLKLNTRNDSISEDYVISYQTQERIVPDKPRAWLSIRDNFVQTAPTEPFMTKVYKDKWNDGTKVDVRVFRFKGMEDFIATRKEYDKMHSGWNDYYPDKHNFSQGLAQVMKEDVEVQNQDNIDFLQLGKNLEPGYYFVEFHLDGRLISDQVWYQSSELAAYISLGKEQTIVWANNLATKTAAASTLVRSNTTGGTWYTDSKGIAKFPTDSAYFDKNKHYFELSDLQGNSLVLPVPSFYGRSGPGEKTSQDYWSYLYTEKIYYAANDTVSYWGIIKDRNFATAPANAKIILSNGKKDLLAKEISALNDGSFIGKLPLVSAPAGWYTLDLKINDKIIDSVGFQVTEYSKPDMKIEITADKKAVFTDEEVKFKINTSFFDETPGSHVKLNVYQNYSSNKTDMETDDNGTAEYTIKPVYSENSNYPRYEGITSHPALTQQSIIEGNGNVQVFGPRILLSTQRSQTDDKASLTTAVNRIDLKGINEGTTSEYKGESVPNQEIKIKVEESWTERIENGTFYNFIEKITYKRYDYKTHREEIINKSQKTDGVGKLFFEFDMKNERSYEVTFETTDDGGHKVKESHFFYASKWFSYFGGDDKDSNIYLDIAFGRDTNFYSINDDVNLKLTQQGEDYKDEENDSYLFTTAIRGNQDTIVSNIPYYSFKFSEQNKPNTFVGAVVFNGSRYKKANTTCRRNWRCGDYYYDYNDDYYDYSYGYNTFNGLNLVYESDNSKLDVEIKYSKNNYSPGETAVVEAKVSKNGSAVAGASVNLVLADAALAAIGGFREPTTLGSLYQNISHQIYYVYTSHEPIVADVPQAEKGGGGGDREIFKDTAAFLQSQTDANGIARFNFKLPDNITTWLTYAQAVTTSLDAGQSGNSIIVTKDFFVTSKFPQNIIESDEAYISANSFGKALKQDDSVKYNVIYSQNGSEIQKLENSAKAFSEIDFKFPKIGSGTYDVTVRGQTGDLNDGIKLPLEIIKSRLKQDFSVKHIVDEGNKLDNLITDSFLEEEPVVLIVSDKGKGMFFENLRNYCWGASSNRLEKRISGRRADLLLTEKFDYDRCMANNSELSQFQNDDGGLAQVNWGGSFLPTTLWAFIIAPDEFDKEKLTKYFDEKYTNNEGSTTQKIQAGWALSMLGESKLRELKALSSSALAFEDRIYLALALAHLGDTEVARNMYLLILADYGYELPPYIRVDANQDRGNKAEDFVVDTSKVLLLGELVDKKYNPQLYAYVTEHKESLENYLIDLSEIAYIEREINALPDSDTVFDLTTAAGNERSILDKGRSKTYELNSNDINKFNFDLISGKAELSAKYMIGIDTLITKKTDNRITISRKFEKVHDEGKPIKPGDLIRIRLDLTIDLNSAPKGSYIVKDILPSGFSFLSNPWSFGLNDDYYAYPQSVKNVTTFHIYPSLYYFPDGHRNIVYFAKATAAGRYKAEPAVFQSQNDLNVFNKTGEDEVIIE